MLKNLGNFKFIGDLSLEDADLLSYYGKKSTSILEYGVGGSTHILAQCMPSTLISVDTSAAWIDITQKRLNKIDLRTNPKFYVFNDYINENLKIQFDLIFVDGLWEHRKNFAVRVWPSLSVNGVMIFHDTRRDFDYAIAMESIKDFYLEVQTIEVNARASNGKSSNLTVIHKKNKEPYVNWNDTENKPKWAYGDLLYDGDLWQQES